MVPIYSVDSWLSLSFKDAALYLDMLRDCYEASAGGTSRVASLSIVCDAMDENASRPHHPPLPLSPKIIPQAYVLYLFLALLVAYLGGGDEEKVVELLEKQPRVRIHLSVYQNQPL